MQIERDGKRLSLANHDGKDAFYANLEDYVRLLQDQGANVYLVLGVPVHLTSQRNGCARPDELLSHPRC